MYNPTDNEISLKDYNMHLYCDHTVYSFLLYTFLWHEDGPQWPKHVVVSSITYRIRDSCVVTYRTQYPTHSLTVSSNVCLSVSQAGFSFYPLRLARNHWVSVAGKYEPNHVRYPRHIYVHYISMEINTFTLSCSSLTIISLSQFSFFSSCLSPVLPSLLHISTLSLPMVR